MGHNDQDVEAGDQKGMAADGNRAADGDVDEDDDADGGAGGLEVA